MESFPIRTLLLKSCLLIILLTSIDSLGTRYGHRKIHERKRRAAAGYQVPNGPQARFQQPSYPASQNAYQQSPNYQVPQQYAQSAIPYGSETPSQYVGYINPAAIASASNAYRQNGQTSANPAYSAAAGYGSINQQYPGTQQGYSVQPTQAAYPASPVRHQPSYSYPAGAYQVPQNGYAATPGQNGYPNYQAAARNPQQYNFNGYNPYANQQAGYGNGNNMGYGQLQGRAAAAPATAPLVVAPQSNDKFVLAEFCQQQQQREPKCTKNSFGMCDSSENYPSEVANEFYSFFKSRIIAMATDFDYSNSDQYDTGFATQQNKLIDFVHEIFSDDEFGGGLPGVPPVKKGLCMENSDILQPGWAKTSRGKWTVIMNSNNIKQSVRAGMCKNAGKSCNSVPKCYKSECRQRFRYDTLLVFDPCDSKKPPMLELFKIPDGCECFVLQDEPDLQAPLPTVGAVTVTPQQFTKQTAKGRSGDFAAALLLKAVNEAGVSLRPTTAHSSTTTGSTTVLPPSTTPESATTLTETTPSTVISTTPSTTTSTTTASTAATLVTSTMPPTTLVPVVTTTESSAGIPPRSSLILSPRVILSTDLQAL